MKTGRFTMNSWWQSHERDKRESRIANGAQANESLLSPSHIGLSTLDESSIFVTHEGLGSLFESSMCVIHTGWSTLCK